MLGFFDKLGQPPPRPRGTMTPNSIQTLINKLGLAPHPEGGFYRETFRSPMRLGGLPVGGPRNASTAIYYLLPAGTFSALHRVRGADEVWHFYRGDALEVHLLSDDGEHTVRRLGADLEAGEVPQVVVPAGVWQAAIPLGASYSLCGCTVAPGFEFADFDMPSRGELRAKFPVLATVIDQLTRP
jgi:predicted cupin superfamily sugar epimerase